MSHILHILQWVASTLASGYEFAWDWVSQLDRQQWLVLLAVAMVGGFLCMRGYGSRNR